MKITSHAEKRINQRGISRRSLKVIWEYGEESFAPGGACKLFFGQKECQSAISELKKTIKVLEHAKGGVVITASGNIITAYKN